MVRQLVIETRGQGLHEITAEVQKAVGAAKLDEGLCTLFVQHTSRAPQTTDPIFSMLSLSWYS